MNRRIIVPTQKSTYFAVDTYFLSSLLRSQVESIAVDEVWYLARYQDIETALIEGRIATPAEHYVLFGFYEHRMPYQILIDEPWYLDRNGDVRDAVASGAFPSAQAHFDELGFREGRYPYPDFSLRKKSDAELIIHA